MSLLPITITRLDGDHYVVGRVTITRVTVKNEDTGETTSQWKALPPQTGDRFMDRALFTETTLEAALEMAAGFVTLLAPADGYDNGEDL